MWAALGVDAPGHQIDGRELLRAHGEVGRLGEEMARVREVTRRSILLRPERRG